MVIRSLFTDFCNVHFDQNIMNSSLHRNRHDFDANPALSFLVLIFFLIISFFQVSCTGRQKEAGESGVFDVFQFNTPEGFTPAYDGTFLALNSSPDISNCSFVFTLTLPGSEDPKRNFEETWSKLIAPALAEGSTERKVMKDNRDGWKGYAGTTIVTSDTLKLQFELRTYTRDGYYVSAMFFFEPEKCETTHKQFLESFSLADDASQNGPPAGNYYVTREPEFLSPEPLTGVWLLMKNDSTEYFNNTGKENFITFLDRGDVFNGLLPYGSFHVGREKQKQDAAIRLNWGIYTLSSNEGNIALQTGKEPLSFVLENDTLLVLGDKKYVKGNTVSGYRLEGVWTTNFSRFSKRLTLDLTNRFADEGIFQSLHDVNPWLFADEKGGCGKYQIYDHTIYLQYDDGRTRSLSFASAAPYDLRATNSVLMIGGSPFVKNTDEEKINQ